VVARFHDKDPAGRIHCDRHGLREFARAAAEAAHAADEPRAGIENEHLMPPRIRDIQPAGAVDAQPTRFSRRIASHDRRVQVDVRYTLARV
jgi:hypothetical protein